MRRCCAALAGAVHFANVEVGDQHLNARTGVRSNYVCKTYNSFLRGGMEGSDQQVRVDAGT